VGIEVGQVAVLVAATVVFVGLDRLLDALRTPSPFRLRVVGVSAAIAVVATGWAVERSPGSVRRLARMARRALQGACLLALPLAPRAAEAHPIHSTLTEIKHDPGGAHARHLRARVRRRLRRGAPAPRRAAAQLGGGGLRLRGHAFYAGRGAPGAPVHLVRRAPAGDRVWLCLRAPAPAATGRLVVHNRIHFELFEDQVNVVQATLGGRRQSVLFTRGDGPKPLR
jgi:hypothetical protein